MSAIDDDHYDDLRVYLRENHELIAQILLESQDPYARACALVLLREAGTTRDSEAVKREIDLFC